MKRLLAGLLIGLMLCGLALPFVAQALPTQPPSGASLDESSTGIVATIKIARLNVRRVPRAVGSILGTLTFDQQVPLVGRNEIATWLEAETAFGRGWIDARYVRTNASILRLPITTDQIPPFATVTTAKAVIVRAGPFDEYPIVQKVPIRTEMDVIGLHNRNTHVQVITPNGGIGWVDLKVVIVNGDLSGLRYTNLDVLPLAKINTFRLRVHAAPDVAATVLGTVRLGQLYTMTALDVTEQWVRISTKFGEGWVLLGYVKVVGPLDALRPREH